MRKTFKALSALLSYPNEELQNAAGPRSAALLMSAISQEKTSWLSRARLRPKMIQPTRPFSRFRSYGRFGRIGGRWSTTKSIGMVYRIAPRKSLAMTSTAPQASTNRTTRR